MVQCYPMMVDVRERLVVIVGGGRVAVRKAKGLLAAGATRVRCVAPKVSEAMPAEVQRLLGVFLPVHLEGAALVFAATDSAEVNANVVREAKQRGIWVNRADGEDGDFTTPAAMREGELVVTVSAGGNPAVAAAIRDEIRATLDERWVRMAGAMGELRPKIVGMDHLAQERRGEILRALATAEALEVLERGGVAGAWTWLSERFEELRETRA